MVITKTNLQKEDPIYYSATLKPKIVDIDTYYFLTISGQCAPEDEQFMAAIEKLYAVAYAIKFNCKERDQDFVVPKMEGYWWVDGAESQEAFEQAPRDSWCWKICIRLPDFVEHHIYFQSMEKLKEKEQNPSEFEKVKLELINEGRSAQILHVGSYDEEKSTIQKLFAFVAENGLKPSGHHHEIYLSDPRKTAPEKLKTIIRYAVS